MSAPTKSSLAPSDEYYNSDESKRYPLDLLSISQTKSKNDASRSPKNDFEQTYASALKSQNCHNNAPYFAIELSAKSYGLWQGNCNDWTCPRCGIMRAKHEYGRIVNGTRILADDHDLYF